MGEIRRSPDMGKISASWSEVVIFADDSSLKRGLVTVRRFEVSITGEIVNTGLYV